MSTTSDPNDLSARLRSRMAADRRQIEETATSELRRLGENLRAVANDELRTIETDTGAAAGRMRVMLLNAWLRPLVIGLSLFLGFSGGSWGLMHWLSTSIQEPDRDAGDVARPDRAGARDAGRDRGHDVGRDVAGDRRGAVRGAAGPERWTIRLGPWAGGLP